jgi:hypothetical protein
MSFVLPYTKELVMNQRSLDRAVAEATGESVDTIRHLGFWLVEAAEREQDQRGIPGGFCANWLRISKKVPSKSLIT